MACSARLQRTHCLLPRRQDAALLGRSRSDGRPSPRASKLLVTESV
jgi:hypothetical protein